ncbi:uncharacterized protein LOC119388850 [Rhipicephalus sanguineus]|uniref:uncharacterized protein LOC119388850 n=1 Tax=Rhipicephalus sanguineus TaxID=34632 RepID=UPI0018958508|nr:uncharacterized protein LOC119388850 [Rhipicephalus sanguineus]
MAKAAKTFVNETLDKNPVVIFSKSYCPFCKKAKQVFDGLGVSYLAVELDNRSDGSDIQKVLTDMTGASTVPRVFFKKQCLGGASDVEDMNRNNKLQPLLKSHGLLK